MRARNLGLTASLAFALLSAPASAQLTAGPGSSNSANQSFQNQNNLRGLQQQQTMDSNQTRGQIRSNQLYNGASQNVGPGPRLGGRLGRHR